MMQLSTYIRFFIDNLLSSFSKRDDTKPLEQLLKETKEHYDPLLPCNADADTRLESVQIEGSSLVFKYTLFNVQKDELEGSEFSNLLADALKSEAQRTGRLRRILEHGGVLVYKYVDMNHEPVTEIRIPETGKG